MGDINKENIEKAYNHMKIKDLLNTSYTLDRLKGIQDLKELKLTEKEYFILYCLILLNLNRGTCTIISRKIIEEYANNSRANIIVDRDLISTIDNLYEKLCNQSSNRIGGFYKQRVIKVIRKY